MKFFILPITPPILMYIIFCVPMSVIDILTTCLGRPTMDGKTALGASSPPKPPLTIPDPLSITRGVISSSESDMLKVYIPTGRERQRCDTAYSQGEYGRWTRVGRHLYPVSREFLGRRSLCSHIFPYRVRKSVPVSRSAVHEGRPPAEIDENLWLQGWHVLKRSWRGQ